MTRFYKTGTLVANDLKLFKDKHLHCGQIPAQNQQQRDLNNVYGYISCVFTASCELLNYQTIYESNMIQRILSKHFSKADNKIITEVFKKSKLFHTGGLYHIEASPFICRANQWTRFRMIRTSVKKELRYVDVTENFCSRETGLRNAIV